MIKLNVWEVCEFNDDIKFGRLELNKFAVELYSVIKGEADDVYKDPNLFLSNTYLTDTMKHILQDALKRLTSGVGQPVYVIDTEFGGGKTHTLLLLYHIFKSKEVGSRFIREYKIDREIDILEVPEVRVVAIDCRRVEKNTLWGELADKLGRYEAFKAEDLERKPIYDIGRITALLDRPTLILIDELPDYLLKTSSEKVGETTLSDLTISFMLNLVSAVNSSKNSMLIISLTAKQQLYADYTDKFKRELERKQKTLTSYKIEELYDKSREAFSRQARFVTPIDREEVSKVIKRRLIKKIKEDKVKSIVNEYYKYYVDKGIIIDPTYKERLEVSYPFHPFLIDVLYERVSTIDDFNKTRGILRLLAIVLHRIARDRLECKVVSTGDIPLDDREVNDELTSKLGKADLKPVIETDCKEKAKEIDKNKNVKIAEKIARTIYLYSLIGSSRISGIRVSDLKLAICQPWMDPTDPTLVEDVLNEIERNFWYIKKEEEAYYFDKEPNINKIIYDYKKEVRDDEVKEAIYNTLESLLPNVDGVKCIIWSKEGLDDDGTLKFFAIDPYLNYDEKYIEGILDETYNGGIRDYKNTIVLILPDKESMNGLLDSAKWYCAIKKVKESEKFKLDKDKLKKIDERLNEAEGNLITECKNVYSRVAYPRVGDGQLAIDDILITITKQDNITEAVRSFLREKGKLVERLEPSVILDIMKDEINEDKINVEEVYDRFMKDKRKPFILKGEVIIEAIREGVRKGLFGYVKEQDGKYVRSDNIEWEGYIVSKDAINELVGVSIDTSIGRGVDSSINRSAPIDSGVKSASIEDYTMQMPTYRYKIECKSWDEIINNINVLTVIITETDVMLDVSANNDKEDEITIKSKLKNREEIKTILNDLKRRGYSGSGYFIINSKKDLSNEFDRYGMKGVRSLERHNI